MTQRNPLYTIGHSSLTTEQFLVHLRLHRVSAVADVRSQPYSRMYPHFSQPSLREALRKGAIQYVYLGAELGARRDEPECYVNGQARYDRIVETPAFLNGIQRVVEGAETETIALVCAERDPLICHRSILVCRTLRDYGLDIRHILIDGSIETLHESELRLMREEGLKPDQLGLFEETNMVPRIVRAYDLRGEKIAYRMKEES